MRFRNAVVFITGGAGFTGSAVVRHLLDDTDAYVVNIDKLTYAACLDSIPQATTGHSRYRFAQVDICNGSALRQLFDRYQPRYVMNLAAESHVDRANGLIVSEVMGGINSPSAKRRSYRPCSYDTRLLGSSGASRNVNGRLRRSY
jgi:dTDP-D-glucose 4,6-dehydratase